MRTKLGAPLAPAANSLRFITCNGSTYGYQPFARDTLISNVNDWSTTQKLNDLLNKTIPNNGLARQILEAVYLRTGGVFHDDWSFHHFAVQNELGYPLTASYRITVADQAYSIQVFSLDTLYTPLADPIEQTAWNDVRKLSDLDANDLAHALWQETYKPSGAVYDPNHALHRFAVTHHLGAPLSGVITRTLARQPYSVQIFAADTLYSRDGQVIERLRDLPFPLATPPIQSASTWLDQHPSAPSAVYNLIHRAISMIGHEDAIFDALPENLRTLAWGYESWVSAMPLHY